MRSVVYEVTRFGVHYAARLHTLWRYLALLETGTLGEVELLLRHGTAVRFLASLQLISQRLCTHAVLGRNGLDGLGRADDFAAQFILEFLAELASC